MNRQLSDESERVQHMMSESVVLFLAGDVMTGRGVDQILPTPSAPPLRERCVRDARVYVGLAEEVNGPIPGPVDLAWPWGDALRILDEAAPDLRVINLETSVTRSDDYARGKGIHYRMHPDNVGVLSAARVDLCVLANNHVLDFGIRGLKETLDTLDRAGIRTVGAGRNAEQAWHPALLDTGHGRERAQRRETCRVLIWAVGVESSGVSPSSGAGEDRPGLAFLDDLSDASADFVTQRAQWVRRAGDLVVVSIHWGSNWGYEVPPAHIRFAHRLIDGGVDVVYGHSSHHPRPIEIYRGRPVLYGCGDLINDYEGIRGYERFRDDLRLLYFATLDARTHELRELRMVPVRARRMRLEPATDSDAEWLRGTLDQVSRRFRARIDAGRDGGMTVRPI